jgi:cytochrome c oxidase cbb3-type subunit 1
LVLGFGGLTGLALALWMTARLSRVQLPGGGLIILGALVWHAGLKLGVLGILRGDSSGLEGIELPRYASPIVFAGYLLVAAWAPIAFSRRAERGAYVSQWYLLVALFTFPWFFAAGHLATSFLPVRGVLGAAVQAWYLQNLHVLWFGFLTLATAFYFIPKLTGGSIANRSHARFAFWGLLALGGLGGMARYSGGPFPAWMPSLAITANILLLCPLAAAAIGLSETLRGRAQKVKGSLVLWFVVFAAVTWLAVNMLGSVNSLATVRRVTRFSLLAVGLDQLAFVGGFAMAALGGLYFMVPRFLGRDWPSALLAKVHFFGCAAAVVVLGAAYLVGGLVHGVALNQAELPFIEVVRRYLPFASTGTLAFLLFLVANVAFALNGLYALALNCRATCVPAVGDWLKPLPAEVKA